jgi:hypothetical protein
MRCLTLLPAVHALLSACREAALAEEAARRSQLDSEARVNSALAGVTGQQEQLQGRLAGLADTTEALKEQLAALQVGGGESASRTCNTRSYTACITLLAMLAYFWYAVQFVHAFLQCCIHAGVS